MSSSLLLMSLPLLLMLNISEKKTKNSTTGHSTVYIACTMCYLDGSQIVFSITSSSLPLMLNLSANNNNTGLALYISHVLYVICMPMCILKGTAITLYCPSHFHQLNMVLAESCIAVLISISYTWFWRNLSCPYFLLLYMVLAEPCVTLLISISYTWFWQDPLQPFLFPSVIHGFWQNPVLPCLFPLLIPGSGGHPSNYICHKKIKSRTQDTFHECNSKIVIQSGCKHEEYSAAVPPRNGWMNKYTVFKKRMLNWLHFSCVTAD